MLPTNSGKAKDQGCNPVSSNCVVWQGPDLGCIGICKGDTISEVLNEMATQLCALIEMFDLSQFDFSCLSIPTSENPGDVGDLIQILIERVCTLENITPTGTTGTTGECPDGCIVNIASCFYYTNQAGDVITTMPLTEYITAIGNRICTILTDITVLQNDVATLQQQAIDTSGDVEDLQLNKASKDSLEYQVNAKTSPSAGIQYITDALRYVENFMLGQSDASGSPTSIYQNILKQGNIGEQNRMFGDGTMQTFTGWTNSVYTTADSIGNLWLAVDDLRKEVNYMKENCCSTGCSTIWLNFRASLTASTVTLFTDGSTGFTDDWKECTGTSKITITDAYGNSTTITTSLLALIAVPSGYQFDLSPTSVDFTTDLTVVAETCFKNTSTDTQCESDYSDVIINSAACPAVVLTAFSTSVNYQFTSTAGYTYIINIYYNGGGVPVASQIIATPGVIVLQSIMGLLSETDYDFELVVVNGKGEQTPCPKQLFTTLASDCQPPINASAMLTI